MPATAPALKVPRVCLGTRQAARSRNIWPFSMMPRSGPQARSYLSSLHPADPATRWTAAHRGPAFFAYSTNYLIDVENAIIVDVEATTAIRQAEMTAAKRMVERSITRFDLYPARLIGDSAYGSAEMLNWLVHEQGIEPHIPVFDKSQRTDGTLSRDAFTYDYERDCYICPAGKELRKRQKIYRVPRPLVDEDGMMRYRASKLDCEACS